MAAVKVRDELLFTLVHDFFLEHLTKLKNRSPNTVRAYRESLNALFDFVKSERNIALSDMTFEMIDHNMLIRFLDYLETERGCSIATRNHRLNRIRAFYKYAASMEPTAVIHQKEILKVPLKTVEKADIVEYMSMDAVKAILKQPDTTTTKGLRDQFLMTLLYDTGARIQELMDICLCDIRLGKTPTIILHGKGGKSRSVPLQDATIPLIQNYMNVFHAGENAYSKQHLFFTFRNGRKKPMHHDTARRLIHEYGDEAREHCHDVPGNVHPHLWRHTRAMHLYQSGVDLTLVGQWLGHVHLQTTLMYAKADTELKRKAMAAANASGPLAEKLNMERYKVNDDDLIRQLYGLR
jgi:site-specific recombinase XerD